MSSNDEGLALQQEHEVGIFWDYENVCIPSRCSSATAACLEIEKLAARYGRIQLAYVYADHSRNDSNMARFSAGINSTSFKLLSTPRRGMTKEKETVDRNMLEDMIFFGLDTLHRGDRPCIVLISSDGDFASTINKLKSRGATCVVIHGNQPAEFLTTSAYATFNMELDVLRNVLGSSDNNMPKSTNTLGPETQNKVVPSSVFKTRPNNLSQEKQLQDALLLCTILSPTTRDCWVPGGKVGLDFRKACYASDSNDDDDDVIDTSTTTNTTTDPKLRFKMASTLAVQSGWIRKGRRLLSADGSKIVASATSEPHLSNEIYLQLTESGALKVASDVSKDKGFDSDKKSPIQDDSTVLSNEMDSTCDSLGQQSDNQVSSFCRALQSFRGDALGWVDGCSVGARFHKETRGAAASLQQDAATRKKNYKDTCARAIRLGYVQEGRPIIVSQSGTEGPIVVTKGTNEALADLKKCTTLRTYLRLTDSYRRAIESAGQSESEYVRLVDTVSHSSKFMTTEKQDVVALCGVLRSLSDSTTDWVFGCDVGSPFRRALTQNTRVSDPGAEKKRYKAASSNSIQAGLVEEGRPLQFVNGASGDIVVTKSTHIEVDPSTLERCSPVVTYLRLTEAGLVKAKRGCVSSVISENQTAELDLKLSTSTTDESEDESEIESKSSGSGSGDANIKEKEDTEGGGWLVVEPREQRVAKSFMSSSSTRDVTACLFIKNVSVWVNVTDLVHYIETEHNVKVVRANGKRPDHESHYYFVKLAVESSDQASRLVSLAADQSLQLRGRTLSAEFDKWPSFARNSDPTMYYELGMPDAKPSGLYFENLPNGANICAFVKHVEETFSVTFKRASIGQNSSSCSYFWNAHAEMKSIVDERKLLEVGAKFERASKFQYCGRNVWVKRDFFVPDWSELDQQLCHDRLYCSVQED